MTDPDPQLVDLADQLKTADDADKAGLRDQMFARYLELVRGGTTTAGLPYPDPDDPWFEGADAIRALAEALDPPRITTMLPQSSPPKFADLPSTYPLGWSAVALSGTAALAAGWPFGCIILTFKSTGVIASQWIIQNTSSPNTPAVYFRTGSTSWTPLVGGAAPYAEAAGKAAFPSTAGNNTTSSVTVTFPAGRFSAAPLVQITPESTKPHLRIVSVNSVGTSSFIAYYTNTDGTGTASALGAPWHAVQMNGAGAAGFLAAAAVEDDAVVACPTDGCDNHQVPLAVPTHYLDDDGAEHPVDEVVCGVCGTVLTPTELPDNGE